jgi:hypothetical protein
MLYKIKNPASFKLILLSIYLLAVHIDSASVLRQIRQITNDSDVTESTKTSTVSRVSTLPSVTPQSYTTSKKVHDDQSTDTYLTYNTNDVKPDKNGKIIIKIGHIGAVGALPNGDKIMNMSRLQLIEEGILGDDLDIQ